MIKLIAAIFFVVILGACSSAYRVNGWYPVADIPDNRIEGKAIVTTKDFDVVTLDTVSFPDMAVIEGKLKADKVNSIEIEMRDGRLMRIPQGMPCAYNPLSPCGSPASESIHEIRHIPH